MTDKQYIEVLEDEIAETRAENAALQSLANLGLGTVLHERRVNGRLANTVHKQRLHIKVLKDAIQAAGLAPLKENRVAKSKLVVEPAKPEPRSLGAVPNNGDLGGVLPSTGSRRAEVSDTASSDMRAAKGPDQGEMS